MSKFRFDTNFKNRKGEEEEYNCNITDLNVNILKCQHKHNNGFIQLFIFVLK